MQLYQRCITSRTYKCEIQDVGLSISKIKKKDIDKKNESCYMEHIESEKSIWKAVILQGILDISSCSRRTEDVIARQEAIKWFDLSNKDFLTVCKMADLIPEYVIKKTRIATSQRAFWIKFTRQSC
jgi:hypothetical protein